MKLHFLYFLLCAAFVYVPIAKGQSELKGCINMDDGEPNSIGQVVMHNNEFYVSGDYFDSSIGRWTGYFSKLDNFGNIEYFGTEKEDTIIGFSISNKVLNRGDSIFIMGGGVGYKGLYSLNVETLSEEVSNKFYYDDINMSVLDIEISIDNTDFLLAGGSDGDITTQNVKIINSQKSDQFYEEVDLERESWCLHLRKTDNYYVGFCVNRETINGESFFTSYLTFIDKDLNLIKSTLENQEEFRPSRGFLIDSLGDILCAGFTSKKEDNITVFETAVIKYDSDGNLLWKNIIDENVVNDNGWGEWNNIIESNEGDGYILVGSENKYASTHPDSILSLATIAKIDFDGNMLWKRDYPFRLESPKIVEVFYDVVTTGENGYFVGGVTRDFSPQEIFPWTKSIYVMVDNNGNVQTVSSLEDHIDDRSDILIYPNPVSESLQFANVGYSLVGIEILDSNGKVVYSYNESIDIHTYLNVGFLEKGIYFISFFDKDGSREIVKFSKL